MFHRKATMMLCALVAMVIAVPAFGKGPEVKSKVLDLEGASQPGTIPARSIGTNQTTGNSTVTAVLAAQLPNAYSSQSSNTNLIACDPYSGLVTIVHRQTTDISPTSGYMYYTASFDNGVNWVDVGPWNGQNTPYTVIETIRHPNMIISNPTQNTDPFSTDIKPVMFTNTLWPADWATLLTATDAGPFLQTFYASDTFTTITNPRFVEEMTVNQSTGRVYATVTEPFFNGVARHGFYWSDDAGTTWNFVPEVISAAANFGLTDKAMLDFAPDGNNGIYGFDGGDLTSSGEWKFAYMETNDGGASWGALNWVPIASVSGLTTTVNSLGGEFPFVDFIAECDMVVDANGDPHFAGVFQDTLDLTGNSSKSLYEIYRKDGAWYGKLISMVDSTRFDLPGGLQARNETELARNTDGTVIYAKWIHPTPDSGNNNDVWISARWVDGGDWTPPVNVTNTPGINEKYTNLASRVTDETEGDGRMHIYYTIFGDGDTNDLAPSEFWYLTDVIGDPGPGVGIEDTPGALPADFVLHQNYPNPFNPSTTIAFTLGKAADVKVEVFSITGQKLATLAEGFQNAGTYEVTFDAANFASGLYFYKLTSGSFSATKKMVLMK